MAIVTDHTRLAVWNFLCDLDMCVRYYGERSDQLHRHFIILRLVLLTSVLAEGLLMYLTANQPWSLWVVIPLGIVLGGLAVWDSLSGYSRDSAFLKYAASDAAELRDHAAGLWRDIETYRVEDDDAEAAYTSIRDRWRRLSDRVMVQDDQRLLSRCAKDSNVVVEREYAV
jgi:hypothetical protein